MNDRRTADVSFKMKILLVCMGNICRSPMAEAVVRRMLESNGLAGSTTVASAGTHDFNVGLPPDPRARLAALRRGYDMAGMRARRVRPEDFENYNMILAMDRRNLAMLQADCPAQHRHKLTLFLAYAAGSEMDEVPDPYGELQESFERVLDLIEDAAQGLTRALRLT
ncbi:MAG: low molecular weight protein-tyrosine-phosphatase [Burkholderiales bacterium]